ncbi:hypothetical protein Ahy_B09g098269 [Arachis hypogaea]|uniref:Uncharacterized protein n=1 Tax=Arachis hypogaea TaxID=3818 RepID=A0A444XRH5_ARAHY|nr:hypothetical protein Ahy_B09g098269 [Arachis hypogaea]
MEKLLDIMFHHGGTFKKNDDEKLVYSPDNRSCLGDLDEDTLDVFFVRNYFKEMGYDKVVECWWLVPEKSLEVGLRALTSDDELREMCFHAEMNDGVVDVFFEHGVSTPELMEGKRDVMLLDYEVEEFSHGDLQSNKETHVDTSNQTLVDKSTTNPIPNLSTANTIPSTATPIPNHPAAEPLTTNPSNEEPNPMDEPGNPKPNYRPNPKSSRKSNPTPIVKHNQKPTPKPKNLLKPKKNHSNPKSNFTSKPKPKFNPPKRITRSQAKGKSTNKDKGPLHVDLTVNESGSSDGSSSNDEELVARVSKPSKKEVKKVQKKASMGKGKEKIVKDNIMQDDDAIVEDLSDVEVDLGFVRSPGEGIWYEALDPGAESDGANSWHSEEMKTPPNSEDEMESDGDSDEFPIFQGGQRFGELQLQVGMKFNTKQEFREAMREFTIQEGRGIKFVKNDNIRCRAVRQVEECAWVVYASRDHEDCCWQIKTFYDDHTCPRENSNRAANRAW